MSDQAQTRGFVKKMWRKWVLPRIVLAQLLKNDKVAKISRLHMWSLRVPGEETLKVRNLCRRVERRMLQRSDLRPDVSALHHRDDSGKLVSITIYTR